MRTHIRYGWLLIVLPACSLAAGCGQGHGPGGPPPQQALEVAVSRPVYDTVTDYEDFPGRIEATNAVTIQARVTGHLTKVHFQDGTEVKQGDLLFDIDDRIYKADLAFAKGTVMELEGRLERLETDYWRDANLQRTKAVSQEALDKIVGDRKETQGALVRAKGSLQKAELNVAFTEVRAPLSGRVSRRFLDPGALVKADETALTTIVALDPIYAYFDLDERSTLRARQYLRDRKLEVSPRSPFPLLLGLADEDYLCGIRVQLNLAKLGVRNLTVDAVLQALRAKDDVRVMSGPPRPGQEVELTLTVPPRIMPAASAVSLAVLVVSQEVQLTLIVPARLADPKWVEEFTLKTTSSGQPTRLKDVARVEHGPKHLGFPRRGKIEFADNRVDPDTGTWRFRATFDNPDKSLYPGLYVRCRLPIGERYEAILVAEQALGADQGQKYLYVAKPAKDKDGKSITVADYRRVKVGRLHDGLRVIIEGLQKDEQVIVSGLQRVRPGIEVRTEVVPMPVILDPSAPTKSEARNPKSETNPKSEQANPKRLP